MKYLYGADLSTVYDVTVPYSTVHIYNINARLPYGTVPYGTLTSNNMYIPRRQVMILFNIAKEKLGQRTSTKSKCDTS